MGIAALAVLSGGKKKRAFVPPEYDGPRELQLGHSFPNVPQAKVVARSSEHFSSTNPNLIRYPYRDVVFKDEEKTGADRYMTQKLAQRVHLLAQLVRHEWPKVQLRVTEAWDPESEHSKYSTHYEGRAVDITTSDIDPQKYGRLAGLAIQAGFDWVFYEDKNHIHASVQKDW